MILQSTFLSSTPQQINPSFIDVVLAVSGPGIGGMLSITIDTSQATLNATNSRIDADVFSLASGSATMDASVSNEEAAANTTLDNTVAADQTKLATDEAADAAAKAAQAE
jgi:hypothetical protein